MQTANVMVALGGDTGNTVPRAGVTAAEIAVLRSIHGDEAVFDIEPTGSITRDNREERRRLLETYPARDGENKLIVEQLFPGAAARVFEAIDELGLPEEFFKATGRVAAEPAPKKTGRKAASKAAPATADEDDGIGDL
jgi:hypothetical protein